jgi:thiol-disulfide isomerase/thioredoxin
VNNARRSALALILAHAVAGGTLFGVTVGDTPPPISAALWYNTATPLIFEQLQGRVVLLDFWGLWCTPCRKEMPGLVQLQRQFGARGFTVLMVHTPQKAEQLREYLQAERVPLVVAVDTGETARAYGVDAYPTYVLIDAGGKIVAFPEHPPDPQVIERLVQGATPTK